MGQQQLAPFIGNEHPGQKMTSREIAELVEKRHDNVRRTIETLAERGVIVRPQIEDEPETDAMGRPRSTKVYVFSGEQGKRDSIIVVAQLCPEFTARLVDRWSELEKAMQAHMIALPRDFASALRALADSTDRVHALEAQNAELAPKAEALDLISASTGSVTVTQAAKVLSVKRGDLTAWMSANGWIYRQNGSWVAYRQHIQNGRLEYKEANYTDQTTDMACRRPYCHITPKGLAKLAEVFGVGAAA